VDSSDSGQKSVAVSFEHDNEPSNSIFKGEEFLDHLSNS
jgi:hypothetical protein